MQAGGNGGSSNRDGVGRRAGCNRLRAGADFHRALHLHEEVGGRGTARCEFDTAGNLYGTTQYGATKGGFGTVFKLNTKGGEVVLRRIDSG
jgi:uncharacterized repeat protein (TIGR03803 family)